MLKYRDELLLHKCTHRIRCHLEGGYNHCYEGTYKDGGEYGGYDKIKCEHGHQVDGQKPVELLGGNVRPYPPHPTPLDCLQQHILDINQCLLWILRHLKVKTYTGNYIAMILDHELLT